jgi:putative Mn2+ efflux pump MntP
MEAVAQLDTMTQLGLAVGLAMDAFAVSISLGGTLRKISAGQSVRLALAFGGFQGVMPILGYLAGRAIAENAWVAASDHWIAFGLLGFLGGKMIYEARFLEDDEEPSYEGVDPTKSATLLVLAIATSVDALAVGASLAFLHVTILGPSLVIGVLTAVLAVVGAHLGRRIGQALGKRVEVAGGIALILIGLRIVIDHLSHPAPGERALTSWLF